MQTPLHFAVDNRLPEILDRVRQLFPPRRAPAITPLDQLLYGVLAQGLPSSAATAVYRRLREHYPKLLDLRDAPTAEVTALLVGVPAALLKAAALPEILRTIEQAFGSLSLDGLARLDGEAARRFLTGLPRVTDDIAHAVLRFSGFERTVLHIDRDTARPVRRLGLCEPGAPLSALPRQLIERAPASWRADDFAGLSQGLNRVADRWCFQGKPDCGRCPLAGLCPSAEGQKAKVFAFPATRPGPAGHR